MADSPIYYGNAKSSPIYYSSAGGSYGARSPMYYGASRQYGSYGAYGGVSGMEQGGSHEGISISRILRVLGQRWLSVFVFVLIGLIVSFAVYSISPTIYQASSTFTIDMRRSMATANNPIDQAMADYGNTYVEIFNTRLPEWRSEAIVKEILDQYRLAFPKSSVSDAEILGALTGSEMELQRNSRNITISVKSKEPEMAMALANSYAQAIENFTERENKDRIDKAVSQIQSQVDKLRREKDAIYKEILEAKTEHKIDSLKSNAETVKQALVKTNDGILQLEDQERQLVEWEKVLKIVQSEPDKFGTIPSNLSSGKAIADAYDEYEKASGKYGLYLKRFTEDTDEAKMLKDEMESAKQRFIDAAARAYESSVAALTSVRNQLAVQRQKLDNVAAELASVGQKIDYAESSLNNKEMDLKTTTELLQAMNLKAQDARMEADANNEYVKVGNPASLPTAPVSPNPLLIFGIGIFVSFALGICFVLVLDSLEDTVVNLSDIEGRLALKVLAVFPHVRRKKREHVARFLMEDKYSQFSESVAGLRNLLDTPRYESMSNCMLVISTQPGEGKTITSTSLAISYAQTGRKVLHVDFDLRRPRLARIWDAKLEDGKSFSHYLNAHTSDENPDFSSLVCKTDMPNVDTICSLPPDGVSPSSIFGSNIVTKFFEWARANYNKIIVDSPPFGLVGDVVSLAVMVDSVVVMCCPDRTHFKPIQFCSRSLSEAGANILGVVVNDVDISTNTAFSPSSRHTYGLGYAYNYAYNGYGYGYASSRAAVGDGDNPKDVSAHDEPPPESSGDSRKTPSNDDLADEE